MVMVRVGLRLGLDLLPRCLEVMHTYLYYVTLSLSLSRTDIQELWHPGVDRHFAVIWHHSSVFQERLTCNTGWPKTVSHYQTIKKLYSIVLKPVT